MFGFLRKPKVRRQRAKQLRAESTESLWKRYYRRIGLWPTAVTLLFFLAALLVSTMGEQALPYSLNQSIGQPILARVNFTVDDPKQGAANIKSARETTPSYYRINTELIDRVVGELTTMYEAAQVESLETFQQRAAEEPWPADEAVYERLNAADEAVRDSFTRSVERLRSYLANERTALPTVDEDRDPPSTTGQIVVQIPEALPADAPADATPTIREETIPTLHLIQIGNRAAIEGRAQILAQVFEPQLRTAVKETLVEMLSTEPLLTYDRKRTNDALAIAEQKAEPGLRHFEKGKPFVFPRYRESESASQGRELGLTGTDIDLLEREEVAYRSFLRSNDPEAVKARQQQRYEGIGATMVLFVLSLTLFAYVGLHRPRVFEVKTRTLAFAGLLLACLVAVRFIDTYWSSAELALAPVILAAAILTIAYPQRFAAGVTVIFGIIVSLIIRADIGVMVTLLAGAFVTAHLLNDIRSRTKIISTGLATATVVFFVSFAFGLINRQEVGFALVRSGYAAGYAVLAALIIQAALPFIERAFGVATSLTLLEYRAANRPLLQRLAREAPGTYNHSLVLGTMCEAACEAIGADGLLAHVGALYHDIGKIPKAEYFAENQEASINRHDNLSPTMSLLIILGHVKDGIEMAKEYGLPRVLHPFIAEHHGTTVVRYFHHAASEKRSQAPKGKHDREVSEAEFRYPGPKPSSRETAILMLCDGVEGAVRALHEPNPGRIEAIVHQVLQDRLKDGQFDNCEITLRELHMVEESVVKSLCRFYHGRVAYPKSSTGTKTESRPAASPAEEEKRQLAG